jgi:hypothetical protein
MSTGSTIHVILSPPQADEESSGWSHLLRFFVVPPLAGLLRMTVNGESLNLSPLCFSDEKRSGFISGFRLEKIPQ